MRWETLGKISASVGLSVLLLMPVAGDAAMNCSPARLQNVTPLTSEQLRSGLIEALQSSPSHDAQIPRLNGLSDADFRRATEKALIETHLEGEILVGELQKLFDQGLTLEEVHRTTSIYSRLQALRYLRETLESTVLESFEAEATLSFSRESQPGSKFLPGSWLERWRVRVGREFQTLAQEMGISESVLPHVFGDLERQIDSGALHSLGCLSDTVGRGSMEALPLPKARVRSDLEQVGKLRREIHADAFVEDLTQQIELEKQVNQAVEPKTSGPVHYPDLGAAGNMVGNTFPTGVWAMTYDDGPGAHTEKLLQELRKRNVQATFFVQGEKFSAFPEMVKRTREDGHTVASHSYSHPLMPELSAEGRRRQITQAVRELEDVLGEKTRFFRLPYGAGVNSPAIRQLIKDAGLIHAFWSVDTLDWQIKTVSGIVENSMKQIRALQAQGRNRGMILFHDIHQRTVGSTQDGTFNPGASLQVIDELLKDPSVRFLTLDQIVDELNCR